MNIDFTGQVGLVTGGTRGIGGQIARDLLNLGAEVVITGRSNESISQCEQSLDPALRDTARFLCVDFSDRTSTEAFLSEIRKLEKIDLCVNNAGINRINYIDETLVEDWDDIAAVNLTAPFLITREVSAIMKRNRYGRIINIGSIFGHLSKEKRSIYSATKFGLKGLTVSVSNELARYNILVNTVSPGFVLTDLTRSILSEQEMKELQEQIPAKRLAEPVDISRTVLFLASTLNTYITGQNIIVDGGFVNV